MTMFEFNEKNILDTLSANKDNPEECLKIIDKFKEQCSELAEFFNKTREIF